MVLKKEWIQDFINQLRSCEYKSRFDDHVISTSDEELLSYSIEDWKNLFKQRLVELRDSDFDWTHFSDDPRSDWVRLEKHANHIWFQFAERIAEQLEHPSPVTVIFPDIFISPKDINILLASKNYGHLYYNKTYDRLMLIDRIITYLNAKKSTQFGSYDRNFNIYPLAVEEAKQIFRKKGRIRIVPSASEVTYRDYMQNLMRSWDIESNSFDFDDITYYIFRVIKAYFSCYDSVITVSDDHSTYPCFKEFQDSLEVLCQKIEQKIEGFESHQHWYANFLYGQQISSDSSGENTYTFLDILIELKGATFLSLSQLLPQMIGLSIWNTKHNPAQIVQHPAVDRLYQELNIGPYCTREKISIELAKLFHYRREITDDEIDIIQRLLNLLANKTTTDDEIFSCIRQLFCKRDETIQINLLYNGVSDKGVCGSIEFIYHRTGINKQYVRIARLLDGWGLLKKYDIDNYFLLIMPGLKSAFDKVTLGALSDEPFSMYLLPDKECTVGNFVEKDRTYLINLNNSRNNYIINGSFDNMNSDLRIPLLTTNEYEEMQKYASKEFSQYPRVAKLTAFPIRIRTLEVLIDLVNQGMNIDGLAEDDGYSLVEVHEEEYPKSLEPKYIYMKIEAKTEAVYYRVQDLWKGENDDCYKVYDDVVPFKDNVEKQKFLHMISIQQQLSYILTITGHRGHTRPNLSKETYCDTYHAFLRFKDFYGKLPLEEKKYLNSTSMRHHGVVRRFDEIWRNGAPECMSVASRWISTLILDYLPGVKFRSDIENDNSVSLYEARRCSQRLYHKIITNETEQALTERLTYSSSRVYFTSIMGKIGTVMRNIFGSEEPDDRLAPKKEELLISDHISNLRALEASKASIFPFPSESRDDETVAPGVAAHSRSSTIDLSSPDESHQPKL